LLLYVLLSIPDYILNLKRNLFEVYLPVRELNIRTARIISCIYDGNDMIYHMVNVIFYTKNSMEDVMNLQLYKKKSSNRNPKYFSLKELCPHISSLGY